MHCATCMQHFTNVEKATTQYKPEIDEGKIKNHKNLSNENGGYFMHGDLLKNEIQLAKDECCVIFDFGCYFPYKNTEDLTFVNLFFNSNFSKFSVHILKIHS